MLSWVTGRSLKIQANLPYSTPTIIMECDQRQVQKAKIRKIFLISQVI